MILFYVVKHSLVWKVKIDIISYCAPTLMQLRIASYSNNHSFGIIKLF